MAKKPPGQSWEGFVEWTIRKAMGEGEFANLPGAGKPIPGLEEPYREDWWLRSMLKREQLSVPCASLDIRRDVEKTLEGLSCDNSNKHHVNVNSDPDMSDLELKTGSERHQHVVGISGENGGTKFGLVVLDLPGVLTDGDDTKQ